MKKMRRILALVLALAAIVTTFRTVPVQAAKNYYYDYKKSVNYYYSNGKWKKSGTTTYKYNKKGQTTEYSYMTDNWSDKSKYSYDSKGRRTKSLSYYNGDYEGKTNIKRTISIKI